LRNAEKLPPSVAGGSLDNRVSHKFPPRLSGLGSLLYILLNNATCYNPKCNHPQMTIFELKPLVVKRIQREWNDLLNHHKEFYGVYGHDIHDIEIDFRGADKWHDNIQSSINAGHSNSPLGPWISFHRYRPLARWRIISQRVILLSKIILGWKILTLEPPGRYSGDEGGKAYQRAMIRNEFYSKGLKRKRGIPS
jgi:hypothetical protein